MNDPFAFDVMARIRTEFSLGFAIGDRRAHVSISGVGDPKRELEIAMARLEEHHPDESVMLKRTLLGEFHDD